MTSGLPTGSAARLGWSAAKPQEDVWIFWWCRVMPATCSEAAKACPSPSATGCATCQITATGCGCTGWCTLMRWEEMPSFRNFLRTRCTGVWISGGVTGTLRLSPDLKVFVRLAGRRLAYLPAWRPRRASCGRRPAGESANRGISSFCRWSRVGAVTRRWRALGARDSACRCGCWSGCAFPGDWCFILRTWILRLGIGWRHFCDEIATLPAMGERRPVRYSIAL